MEGISSHIMRAGSALLSDVSRPKGAAQRATAGYIIRGALSEMGATVFPERSGGNEGATFRTTYPNMRSFCSLPYYISKEKKGKNLGEGRAEPRTAYAVLYAPTTVGRRAQRGATERSEFKKYFSFNIILTGFLFKNKKQIYSPF